ncbi:MAG: nucleoside hydrolase [Erysipelotrichaceae bacterium]|nr:nucleoside hydrolase [Erysipelotrichaceae bacterium]
MDKRKIIFDCDIGCDDAVALIGLLLCDKLDVIAITCVHGNLPVNDVVGNALKVAALCKKDVPVYKGCSEPMVRNLLKGREYNSSLQNVEVSKDGEEILIHQRSFDLPEPSRKAEAKHACTYLIETLMNAEEKIDICAVGPLTNIAMAIRLEPEIVKHIGTLYIMGGGLYIGNRTPLAEANFYDDPEAAEIVLTSGVKCLICPIETCEEGGTYDQEDLKAIRTIDNEVSDFLYEELQAYIERCNFLFNENMPSCCAYDYAAVAPLIDESVILEKHKDIVNVDISGGIADGQMVVDRRGYMKNDLDTEVIYHMDARKIHDILLKEIREFS